MLIKSSSSVELNFIYYCSKEITNEPAKWSVSCLSRNERLSGNVTKMGTTLCCTAKIEYDVMMYEKYISLTVSDFTVGIVTVFECESIFSSEVVDVWTWVVAEVAEETVDSCHGLWVVVGAIEGVIVVDASSLNGRAFPYGEMGGTDTYPRPWLPISNKFFLITWTFQTSLFEVSLIQRIR